MSDSGMSDGDWHPNMNDLSGSDDDDGPMILVVQERVIICEKCGRFLTKSSQWVVRKTNYTAYLPAVTVAWNDLNKSWHCANCSSNISGEIPEELILAHKMNDLWCGSHTETKVLLTNFNYIVEDLD